MPTGFRKTTIDAITIPRGLPDYLPYLIDDGSLAFAFNMRPKILWWLLLEQDALYKVHYIPKRNGKKRVIHAPDSRLKHFQQKLEEQILKPLQNTLGKHVVAYRPKTSTLSAVRQHIPACPICDSVRLAWTPKKHNCPRNRVYIKMDIQDFFSSTRRSWIRGYFKKIGYNHLVSSMLAGFMTVGTIPTRNPGCPRVGVPQGAPTSGTICNLIAHERFDKAILRYFETLSQGRPDSEKWVYTRYSDDLAFTCGYPVGRREINKVLRDIRGIIKDSGYRLNPVKTKVYRPPMPRRILGISAHRHPNITRKEYLRFRAICHNCLLQGFDAQLTKSKKKTVPEYVDWLRGKINYFKQINPQKGVKLEGVFREALTKASGG